MSDVLNEGFLEDVSAYDLYESKVDLRDLEEYGIEYIASYDQDCSGEQWRSEIPIFGSIKEEVKDVIIPIQKTIGMSRHRSTQYRRQSQPVRRKAKRKRTVQVNVTTRNEDVEPESRTALRKTCSNNFYLQRKKRKSRLR